MLIISRAGMRRLLNLEEVAAAAHSIRREGETCRRKTGASVFQVARLLEIYIFSIFSKTQDWELLWELSETEMLLRREVTLSQLIGCHVSCLIQLLYF